MRDEIEKAVDRIEEGAVAQGEASVLSEGIFKDVVQKVAVDWVSDLADRLDNMQEPGARREGHPRYEALANQYKGKVKGMLQQAERLYDEADTAEDDEVAGLRRRFLQLKSAAEATSKEFERKMEAIKKDLPDEVQGSAVHTVRTALSSIEGELQTAKGVLKGTDDWG